MLGRLFRKRKKKVVVLGIDGVPCSLLKRFIKKGIMPNLSQLVQEGTLAEMTASIPEVSSTSWTTFMTGVNPGRHGIYGFMELEKDSYKWRFPNFDDIKSETLWAIADKNNKKSIVLNVPSTYPARKLNGILTAGFVALDLKKATYPESAYEYLKSIGYRMDVDAGKARESSQALAEDIEKTF
jgi:predicted AlkP superfamily phosphohydrolase/phosphomutase